MSYAALVSDRLHDSCLICYLLFAICYLFSVSTGSNNGTIFIAGQRTSPLSVSLISGITDKGSKLKPIYGNRQPTSFHTFFNTVVSAATCPARTSESRPAIGRRTEARI